MFSFCIITDSENLISSVYLLKKYILPVSLSFVSPYRISSNEAFKLLYTLVHSVTKELQLSWKLLYTSLSQIAVRNDFIIISPVSEIEVRSMYKLQAVEMNIL